MQKMRLTGNAFFVELTATSGAAGTENSASADLFSFIVAHP
jgi:hypothetical protein